MVSNALDRSRNTLRLYSCLSKDDRIWEVNSVIAFIVECLGLNPYCLFAVVKYILRIEKSIEALMYIFF